MRDPELLEIYLKLAGDTRNAADDAVLLARLAELAREMPTEPGSDHLNCGPMADALHAIAHSPVLFPIAISAWLSSEEDVPLGKALLHQVSVAHLSQIYPQPYDLAGVDEQQAVIAARRLCALAAAPAVSLGWALSLAHQFSQSALVAGALPDLLDYHVFELPSSTHKLLASNESVFQELDASITTLDRLDQQDADLNALPHLQEFEMTADMRLIFSTLKRSEHREIHRKADDRSILGLIARRINLKYGGHPVVEVRGKAGSTETTMEMFSHELSIELPLSEGTDPVLGNMKRNRLWKGGGA
ncbi:hypothetical protein [Pseudoxanthomonas sp. JBR18]|uniref:hypothetical protein n=1 Tax=Pseudoxanthomonas sp. JBR18 TaxID=2969308 RepID=UPI002304E061|nr:hypothetical protein [Pseudoxanthomonas sp. JBR18]WCE03851.1 hypothetical protein PJ250_17455 [Pseudoxanthomonas sp. JBR18]